MKIRYKRESWNQSGLKVPIFFVSFSHHMQELICEVMEDYKVLEEFLYNLTEEDFSQKWAQIIPPTVKVGHLAAITTLSASGSMCLSRAPAELLSASQLYDHWILKMKLIEKHGFMLPSGLGQGKLVAVNLFNILSLFSLLFIFVFVCLFLEAFARSQRTWFSVCLKLNAHFQGLGRNTPSTCWGIRRNINLYHCYCISSLCSLLLIFTLTMLFRLGLDYAPVAESAHTHRYRASKVSSSLQTALVWYGRGPLCLQL